MKRLLHDIKEIKLESLPGIKIVLDNTNMRKMCLLLTPQTGPYSGLTLHFTATIPQNYPTDPPQIRSDGQISHPNVFGDYICCDILKPYGVTKYENGTFGGYTPAYPLQTVFLQMLSFFSEKNVAQEYGGTASMVRGDVETVRYHAVGYRCRWCGYSYGKVRHEPSNNDESTDSIMDTGTGLLRINNLPDDIILLVLDYLSDKDLWNFANSAMNIRRVVHSYNYIIKRQVICYFSKKGLTENILGIGVVKKRRDICPAEFEWISRDAYLGGRDRTVWGEKFDVFLPLAYTKGHFERSIGELQKSVGLLSANGKNGIEEVLDVIPRLMNATVVKLMKESGNTSSVPFLLSERCLLGYCQLLLLLLSVAKRYPAIRVVAETRVKNFIASETARHKNTTPDIGIFLVYLFVTPNVTWETVVPLILQECFDRAVVWMLDQKGSDMPYMAYIESGDSRFRSESSYKAYQTAMRVLMFQALFIKKIRHLHTFDELISRCGYPRPGMAEELVEDVKGIHATSSWNCVFHSMGLPHWERDVCSRLKGAIRSSLRKGYHVTRYLDEDLVRLRSEVDPRVKFSGEYYYVRKVSFFPDSRNNVGRGGSSNGRRAGQGQSRRYSQR